ncbi:class I adenylate-forming enzyme family protein [Sandaracinobacteroides saxicola]|uniref:Acyl--CoA ligase n=1 Tax=Sandaracinobacteroides saxicola TaxID=2759707 RepID=A0A7G5IGL5_9SPHN|nr:class I adenylate-forming enzyme family protein [Sandaracinobacteroides saxicola]QMW22507.1 acyl--CoA ligase [Sandaracinobacteroides saxicola]
MTDPTTHAAQDFAWMPDLIAANAAARAHAPAVTVDDTTWTWSTLAARSNAVASALQRDGHAPGDAVSICALSHPNYVALWLGALRAGVAVAPLPPSATPSQIAAMVADCGAKLLFLDAASESALAGETMHAAHLRLDTDAFDAWLSDDAPQPVHIKPKMPFNIIYSSGTTGVPKGIIHSQAMRWQHLKAGPALGYTPDAVTLLATPLYSNTTLVAFLPALAWGGHVVLMPKFDTAAYLALAESTRATHSMLVPVQYRRLMAHPAFDAHDLSSFQLKFATSAPFPAALKADVLRRWPGGLIEYYGMTEGGGGTVLVAHNHPEKLHTVGHPIPGHDIMLIGEDGEPVPTGEVGEIVGTSPAIMNGYANRPEATAQTFWTGPDGRTWVKTGDMGRFDADGFLQLMDRAKDMIISGGFNIYPSDLEAILSRHAAVVEVAVIGVPSDAWGETPVAIAVLRPGTTPDALKDWANAQLGKTQRLAAVVATDELPRSAIGKVLKRELRDRWTLPVP